MGLFSYLKKLFQKKNPIELNVAADEQQFAARFHRFKLFLNAHLEISSVVMELEERLCNNAPYGMPFIRSCASKLSGSVMQCLIHLNALSKNRYKKLNQPFDILKAEVQKILKDAVIIVEGPLLLKLENVTEEHTQKTMPLVTPDLAIMSKIAKKEPELFSQGFVLTAAAWQSFMAFNDLQSEIDRTIQISRDDLHLYEAACASIKDCMAEAPLPSEIEDAISNELSTAYKSLAAPGQALLVQCRPVLQEHNALFLPEQLIAYTPDIETAKQACINAFKTAMSFAFRPQSSAYRLKRGIRHRAMPFCVIFSRIDTEAARGDIVIRQNVVDQNEQTNTQVTVHIKRSFTAIGKNEDTKITKDTDSLSQDFYNTILEAGKKISQYLTDDTVAFWALSRTGQATFLSCSSCIKPEDLSPHLNQVIPKPAWDTLNSTPYAGAGRVWHFGNSKLIGSQANFQNITAKAVLVRNLTDAINFPLGAILVMERAAQQWSFMLEFASAIIVKKASDSGYFSAMARLLQKPLFICDDEKNLVDAILSLNELPFLHIDFEQKTLQEIVLSAEEAENVVEYLMIPHSPMHDLAIRLGALTIPVHLPLDPDNSDFTVDNCKSYTDIALYVRAKIMREMLRYGTEHKTTYNTAKQLTTYVPKQFWVVNLNDGFKEQIKGQYVNINQIVSTPLHALWEGIEAVPWEGPPPVNAKGLMSIVFEATINPNLEPTQQASVYTEKNYFMITKDYCNMSSRFGFHYLSLDALLSGRIKENFVIFQFRGGATNQERRIMRVHFIADLLTPFGFNCDLSSDSLTARIEGGSIEQLLPKLRVVGYLVMHTRQLDMIMGNNVALTEKRLKMLKHMELIEKGEPVI